MKFTGQLQSGLSWTSQRLLPVVLIATCLGNCSTDGSSDLYIFPTEEHWLPVASEQSSVATSPQTNSVEPALSREDACATSVAPSQCRLLAKLADEVRFVDDSPDLTEEAKRRLTAAILPLRESEIHVSVLTYIAHSGPAMLDILLAKRRTLSIIRFLASRGIPVARLQPREPAPRPETGDDSVTQAELPLVEMRVLTK